MVKLKSLPEQAVIDGFKGTIDYYVHCGVPCVRSWPRSPGKRRSPNVEKQWPAFATASRLWNTLAPEVRDTYNLMSQTSSFSGRDLFTKSYISGIYGYAKELCMLPACSVYLSANFLNIPSGVATRLPFDTKQYDIGGNYDVVNHRFICPRAGRYLCTYSTFWSSLILNAWYYVMVQRNGIAAYSFQRYMTGSSWQCLSMSCVIDCSASDYLDAFVYHNGGADTPDIHSGNEPVWTHFQVSLIE